MILLLALGAGGIALYITQQNKEKTAALKAQLQKQQATQQNGSANYAQTGADLGRTVSDVINLFK